MVESFHTLLELAVGQFESHEPAGRDGVTQHNRSVQRVPVLLLLQDPLTSEVRWHHGARQADDDLSCTVRFVAGDLHLTGNVDQHLNQNKKWTPSLQTVFKTHVA